MTTDNGQQWHGTTILAVRKGERVVVAGDGQVSLGNTVIKSNARKVRRLGRRRRDRRVRRRHRRCLHPVRAARGQARAASGPAHPRLRRAGQGLAHRPLPAPARGDDGGRRQPVSLVLTGTGDVLEPEDGLIGIGSGGSFALAAARALIDRDDLDAEAIARRAMAIAADICVYTNHNILVESL